MTEFSSDTVQVIECDFKNKDHTFAMANLLSHYKSGPMGDGKPHTAEESRQLIEGLRAHPSKLILLVKYRNEFIGLANCFINYATFVLAPFINIHDIVIHENFRNLGAGRTLLNAITDKAKELGCSKITLEVRDDNENAKHLYQNLGYKDCDPKMHFWSKYL